MINDLNQTLLATLHDSTTQDGKAILKAFINRVDKKHGISTSTESDILYLSQLLPEAVQIFNAERSALIRKNHNQFFSDQCLAEFTSEKERQRLLYKFHCEAEDAGKLFHHAQQTVHVEAISECMKHYADYMHALSTEFANSHRKMNQYV